MMRPKKYIFTFGTIISLIGCSEHRTQNPSEAYRMWSGINDAPKGVTLIHGKYWQSAYWSNEHVLYLELKASYLWRKEFIKQNDLQVIKESGDGPLPSLETPVRTGILRLIDFKSKYLDKV